MSQHYFESTHNGSAVTVLVGWDRPLQSYFMVIERVVAEVDFGDEVRGDYLYSHLNEPRPFGMSLAFYKSKLDELGIAVPDTMFAQTERDQTMNIGNRHVWHEIDGTYRES